MRRLLLATAALLLATAAHAQNNFGYQPGPGPVSGSGTVTSVAITVPTGFAVSGSPITTAGTFGITLSTQTANKVWASATSGGAATPAFRALVGADLPNPSASTLGGVQSIAAVTHNFLTAISTSGVPSHAQPACADISDAGAACTKNTGTSGATIPLLNAANTFSGNTVISGSSFALSGNISAPAWTTAGVRYANVAATLTDTTSSGTVAAAYTDVFSGNTIAASSATTFTNYYGAYFSAPVAGTNVTFTNKFALGTDSLLINPATATPGSSLLVVGQTGTPGITTTTYVPFVVAQRFNAAATIFKLAVFDFVDQSSSNSSEILEYQDSGTAVGCLFKTGVVAFGSCALGSDPDPTIVLSRGVNNGSGATGNAHGIAILDSISRTTGGPIGYAAVDDSTTWNTNSGTTNFDHSASFQSRPILQMSGLIGAQYGLYSKPVISSGATLTSRYGAYVAEATNTGTITNEYGLYVEALTAGQTINYSVYTAGATPSSFGGPIQTRTIYSAAGTPLPTCNGGAEGSRASVSDATAPVAYMAYTSGGSVHSGVYCNGTTWENN